VGIHCGISSRRPHEERPNSPFPAAAAAEPSVRAAKQCSRGDREVWRGEILDVAAGELLQETSTASRIADDGAA
jgi:hypothetical protein